MNHLEHPDSIDGIIKEVSAKDTHVLYREVMSITDTMDVLRAKWNVEILTAIICGQTRFKDILAVVKGISENVLSDRLRQLADDRLIDKQECYGYPPRVEYRLTEHGKQLYVVRNNASTDPFVPVTWRGSFPRFSSKRRYTCWLSILSLCRQYIQRQDLSNLWLQVLIRLV